MDFLGIVMRRLAHEFDMLQFFEEECSGPHHENMAQNTEACRAKVNKLTGLKERLIIRAMKRAGGKLHVHGR